MWCVKLSDSQRDALRALVREQGRTGPTLTAVRPAPSGAPSTPQASHATVACSSTWFGLLITLTV